MTRRVYVVTRIGLADGLPEDNEGGVKPRIPVRAFARREDAEAHCRALKERARRELEPFAFGWSNAPRIQEGLQRLGLPPAPEKKDGRRKQLLLCEWWARVAAEITDEQRAGLWELFGGPPLYQVRELAVEG